jgi:hypothetical protein
VPASYKYKLIKGKRICYLVLDVKRGKQEVFDSCISVMSSTHDLSTQIVYKDIHTNLNASLSNGSKSKR